MTFSPKFLVLGALLVSFFLTVLLLSAPGGAAAQPLPDATVMGQAAAAPAAARAVTAPAAAAPAAAAKAAAAPAAPAAAPKSIGAATLDLALLAKVNSINEADNARWSLVRTTPAASRVYSAQAGVNWEDLRQVSAAGSIALPAGASWSFNATYGGDTTGLKVASGVLAGGQCALATVFRAAAMHASLTTKASQHRSPIPGFPMSETVNIWWGSYDLVIKNTSGRDLSMAWSLTPANVTVSINAQ